MASLVWIGAKIDVSVLLLTLVLTLGKIKTLNLKEKILSQALGKKCSGSLNYTHCGGRGVDLITSYQFNFFPRF